MENIYFYIVAAFCCVQLSASSPPVTSTTKHITVSASLANKTTSGNLSLETTTDMNFTSKCNATDEGKCDTTDEGPGSNTTSEGVSDAPKKIEKSDATKSATKSASKSAPSNATVAVTGTIGEKVKTITTKKVT